MTSMIIWVLTIIFHPTDLITQHNKSVLCSCFVAAGGAVSYVVHLFKRGSFQCQKLALRNSRSFTVHSSHELDVLSGSGTRMATRRWLFLPDFNSNCCINIKGKKKKYEKNVWQNVANCFTGDFEGLVKMRFFHAGDKCDFHFAAFVRVCVCVCVRICTCERIRNTQTHRERIKPVAMCTKCRHQKQNLKHIQIHLSPSSVSLASFTFPYNGQNRRFFPDC